MLKSLSVYLILKVNISLFLLCLLLGCKKTSTPHIGHFSREGLAYIQFNSGKYFIFKDSASGKLDSIVVTKSLLENYTSTTPLPGGLVLQGTGEQYTLVLSKIDSSGVVKEFLYGLAENYGGSDKVVLRSWDFYDALGVLYSIGGGSSTVFDYPPNASNGATRLASMVVNGKTYTDVIFENFNTYTINSRLVTFHYYWAKGVGLIKYDLIDSLRSKSYTLVRTN